MNISAYEGSPPQTPEAERFIQERPLYDVGMVLEILGCGDEHTVFWTRDCSRDAQKLSFDKQDARTLIKQALVHGVYLNSQWCRQNPTGPWAACDAYRVAQDEYQAHVKGKMNMEYYIKFAIGKTGKILLLISCHKSRQESL